MRWLRYGGNGSFLHSIENRFEDKLNSVGFGRYALPEDIADAILFLPRTNQNI